MDEAPHHPQSGSLEIASAQSSSASAAAQPPLILMLLGRSLFPISVVLILGGTFLWGPWITLAVGLTWFILIHIWG